MSLTDWRGNEYDVGDTVLFARGVGQTIEVCEGEVLEIREEEKRYPSDSGFKVKIQPNGRGSRYGRHDKNIVWLDENDNPTTWDKAARHDGRANHRWIGVPIRPVTLSITQNITKL